MKTQSKSGYGTKSAYGTVTAKDIKLDEDSRTVEGYFSAFGIIDSDGDKIHSGSYSKSIKERGPESGTNRKIAHLAFHDVRRPVGVIEKLTEDSKGLRFKSVLGDHDDGENAFKMYKQGIIREHSIGFNYVKVDFVQAEEGKAESFNEFDDMDAVERNGGYWDVTELKLYEGSFVTFGSNPETPNLSAVKSQEDLNKIFDQLNERMQTLIKAIKDGSFSQKYNDMFEVELHNITHQYKSLVKWEPGKPTIVNKPNSNSDEVSKFYQNL